MMNDAYKQIEEKESYLFSNLITPRKLKAVNDNHSSSLLRVLMHMSSLILLAGVGMLFF